MDRRHFPGDAGRCGAFIRRCGGLLFKAGRAILAGGAEGSDGGGRFHGASTLQMIYKFLYVEARSGLVLG